MSKFVILGAGISGCTAGYELGRLGHEVTILEQAGRYGGKVLDYCCKATDTCSRCGVCVAVAQLHAAARQERVHMSTGSTVRQVRKDGALAVEVTRKNPYIDPGLCVECDACVQACPVKCISRHQKAELVQYSVDLASCRLQKGRDCTACADVCPAAAISAKGKESTLTMAADALLVATGHQPFDAARKIRLGYGRFPGVLTGAEAEEILSRQESLGSPADSVAFIQCVGSRDPKEGRNYCSSVCCAYALRLARMLKYRSPQADVTIYYIDLQNFDKTFTRLREELETLGVRFVRSIPFRVEGTATGRLKLYMENPDGDETVVEQDRVVLSVGMGPEPDADRVAGLFGLPRNEFGFFAQPAPHPWLFASGTCREPQSISDSMASARAVALEMADSARRRS